MNSDYPSPSLKRELEIALSRLDQAIQGIAIATNGSIAIYDHDWPIRSVEAKGSDGICRRIAVEPIRQDNSTENPAFRFRVVLDAWKDEGRTRFHWHRIKATLDQLPEDFSEQFTQLNNWWFEVVKVGRKDLTATTLGNT